MEIGSAQRLFSGQLSLLAGQAPLLELCGPFETYDFLEKELIAEGVEHSIIQFLPITLDQMYDLRDAFEREERGK